MVGRPPTRPPRSARWCTPSTTQRVLNYVEIGRKEARLVAGGGRPDHLADGNYLQPTVFADVEP